MATSKPANGGDPEHFYLYIAHARCARIFWHGTGERLILTSSGGGYGNAGMRPELRPAAGMTGRHRVMVVLVSWKPVALVLDLLSALILASYFGSALMHGKDPFAISTGNWQPAAVSSTSHSNSLHKRNVGAPVVPSR